MCQGDVIAAVGIKRCEFKPRVCHLLVLQTSLSLSFFICKIGLLWVDLWDGAGDTERNRMGLTTKTTSGETHTREIVSTRTEECVKFTRKKWVKPSTLGDCCSAN